MTSELLSTIQTICLIVAGLMTVSVTLFVIWHCLLRPPVRSTPFFGGQNPLPAADRETGGLKLRAGRMDSAAAATGAEPAEPAAYFVVRHPEVVTEPPCGSPDAHAGQATVILPMDSVSGPVYVAGLAGSAPLGPVAGGPNAAPPLRICSVEAKRASRRVWLLRQALPKFTAKRYDIIAGPEHAAVTGL